MTEEQKKNKSVNGKHGAEVLEGRKSEGGKANYFYTQFISLLMLMSASCCILVLTRRAAVKFVGYTNITGKPLKY